MGYLIQSSDKRFGKNGKKIIENNEWRPFKELIDRYIEVFEPSSRRAVASYLLSCLKNIKEIRYQDIFRKIGKKYLKYNKGFDTLFAKDVVSALKNHLEVVYFNSEASPEEINFFIEKDPFLAELNDKLTKMNLVNSNEEVQENNYSSIINITNNTTGETDERTEENDRNTSNIMESSNKVSRSRTKSRNNIKMNPNRKPILIQNNVKFKKGLYEEISKSQVNLE